MEIPNQRRPLVTSWVTMAEIIPWPWSPYENWGTDEQFILQLRVLVILRISRTETVIEFRQSGRSMARIEQRLWSRVGLRGEESDKDKSICNLQEWTIDDWVTKRTLTPPNRFLFLITILPNIYVVDRWVLSRRYLSYSPSGAWLT